MATATKSRPRDCATQPPRRRSTKQPARKKAQARPPDYQSPRPLAAAVAQLMTAAADGDELADLDDQPQLPPKVRVQVLDRIEAAYREGLIRLDADAYIGLLCALFPDDFCPPPLPEPTGTAPRTEDRVRVYMGRVRAAVAVFHAGDARVGDRGGLGTKWTIGARPRYTGWRADAGTPGRQQQ